MPSPASTTVFNANDSLRFIEVVSYYDLEDHGESSSDTINYYLSLGALSTEKDFVTLGRESLRMLGMSAKREQVATGSKTASPFAATGSSPIARPAEFCIS